jgi:hypothetical protein
MQTIQLFILPYMLWPSEAIFRGSTAKGTCFAFAKDPSITRYTCTVMRTKLVKIIHVQTLLVKWFPVSCCISWLVRFLSLLVNVWTYCWTRVVSVCVLDWMKVVVQMFILDGLPFLHNFVFFVFSTVIIFFCSGTFSMVIQSQNTSKDNNIYDLICVIRYREN